MIKPTQKYALLERKKIKESGIPGFEMVSNEADSQVLRAKVVAIDPSYLDGVKPGDYVYVYKVKALSVEGYDELFFVEPEHICGWEATQ